MHALIHHMVPQSQNWLMSWICPQWTTPLPMTMPPHSVDKVDTVARLDFFYPVSFHGQTGSVIISFNACTMFPTKHDAPAAAFQITRSPFTRASYMMIPRSLDPDHTLSHLHTNADMLVDSRSTITTVGASDILNAYMYPSKSDIKRRPTTGQVVYPACEGSLTFTINYGSGSLLIICQHTPTIQSSIFSPDETCDTLDYDSYHLTCHCESMLLWYVSPNMGRPTSPLGESTLNACLPSPPLHVHVHVHEPSTVHRTHYVFIRISSAGGPAKQQ
jgi:hypothetical protein